MLRFIGCWFGFMREGVDMVPDAVPGRELGGSIMGVGSWAGWEWWERTEADEDGRSTGRGMS